MYSQTDNGYVFTDVFISTNGIDSTPISSLYYFTANPGVEITVTG